MSLADLDPKRIPRHIACVMDGNGRWAQAQNLPRTEGHKAGEHSLFEVVDGCLDAGVEWLTVYAFSTENWRRPKDEVRFLINFNGGKRFHHAGDTALLMEMQLLAGKVDVALLPIGDNFTMGPEDAVTAVDFIKPKVVVPIHYNTWPPIEQDGEAFKAAVGDRAHVEVMAPGGTYEF